MLSLGYTEFQVPVGHFRLREGHIWHPVETISELNLIFHTLPTNPHLHSKLLLYPHKIFEFVISVFILYMFRF